MPNRDGYEVIQAAAAACPSIKILAMSGGGVCFVRCLFGYGQGCWCHLMLSKPFDIDVLLMIVRNALGTPMGIVQ